jgi:hypothetical protein
MKSWTKPTPEQVEEAVAALARPEHRRYFFDRLENPEWLLPLAQKGFFRDPPEHKQGEPFWSESRYLVRIASVQPEAVRDTILSMRATDNVFIIDDLVNATLSMPAKVAVGLVEKAVQWARVDKIGFVNESLGSLSAHFAKGGETDAALHLASVVLEVIPDPRLSKALGTEREGLMMRHARAAYDLSHYEEILRKYSPQLIRSTGLRALALICDKLDRAIILEKTEPNDAEPWDLSYIWRPAIEDHAQNILPDLKSALISAIRDGTQMLAEGGSNALLEVANFLEERAERWLVYRRIELHLLRHFPRTIPALVASRLTDPGLLNNEHCRHEYSLLLEQEFKNLDEKDRKEVLRLISQGPRDIEILRSNWKGITGREASDDDINRYVESWQRDRLDWILESLPEDWKQRYEGLVARVGRSEHSKFASYTSEASTGDPSPLSPSDFKAKSIDEILDVLKEWIPSNTFFGSTRSSLSTALSSAVCSEPVRFAKEAEKFCGLDPAYVRGFLFGLDQAVRNKQSFEWSAVVRLCQWTVEQKQVAPGRRRSDPLDDPGWEWARSAVADLLREGLNERPSQLSLELRTEVWAVLEVLIEDPSPTREEESYFGSSNLAPLTLSLNTTRGKAMHAVFSYMWWVHNHLEIERGPVSGQVNGLMEMPETRDLLESHLDSRTEPSLAVRSVYGQWFPRLTIIDRPWATENAKRIFPLGLSENEFREAAWNAYLASWAAYGDVFDILSDQYLLAVEHLSQTTDLPKAPTDSTNQLAAHLISLYGIGKLTLRDEVFKRFWEIALPETRGFALSEVGRWLHAPQEKISEELILRMKTLWEWRIAEAAKANAARHSLEMASFIQWFGSGQFDDEWALKQFNRALGLSQATDVRESALREEVFGRLVRLSRRFSFLVVSSLSILLAADKPGWHIRIYESQIREILAAALSELGDARDVAERTINELWSRGYRSFKSLLDANPPHKYS